MAALRRVYPRDKSVRYSEYETPDLRGMLCQSDNMLDLVADPFRIFQNLKVYTFFLLTSLSFVVLMLF